MRKAPIAGASSLPNARIDRLRRISRFGAGLAAIRVIVVAILSHGLVLLLEFAKRERDA